MTTYGESTEKAVNGGGLQAQGAIYGEIVSCGSTRMYADKRVRSRN
ncbi:MAG: hypothetical protein P8J93_06505 [SAR86 cluster bacterium]|nr:hypothetical protein [SAR86 cluster bacterium]